MTVAQDFTYRFWGFGGAPSRCHIRILDDCDKPLVIICSQLANKPGTSVTNAVEIIAQSIQDYLSQDNLPLTVAIQRYLKTSKLTKILDDLVIRLRESKNLTVFALESVKLALEYRETQTARTEKLRKMLWVEHYDASFGFGPESEFLRVNFEAGTWKPSWEPTTPKALAESSGYPEEDFHIPKEVIQQP